MDITKFESYLGIEHLNDTAIDIDTLNDYMAHFMLTVPFENINVQNHIPISINIEDLLNKVVKQHRGGFCYELNHLFGTYLEEKGYEVYRASGTVHQPDGALALEGSHMSLYTKLNGDLYVIDVGFGDLPIHAIPMTNASHPINISDMNGQFRAILDNENRYYIQKLKNSKWTTLYHANLEPQSIQDFSEKIVYNESHPNSIFVKQLLITQPQTFGRATMTHQYLTLSSKDGKQRYAVTSKNYKQFLMKYFNLNVTIDRLEK